MAPTGAADSPLNLDDFLCFAVYSAGHAFNRVYKPLLDALGLTYPQYLAMVGLWAKDDQTVGELGARLALESSTLTPLLKRLEGMGLITRRRDTKDERQVRVALTPAGAALRRQAEAIPDCVMRATGMSEDALRRLLADVSTLRANLEAAAG